MRSKTHQSDQYQTCSVLLYFVQHKVNEKNCKYRVYFNLQRKINKCSVAFIIFAKRLFSCVFLYCAFMIYLTGYSQFPLNICYVTFTVIFFAE
jgi:hypothetical protein